MTIDGRQRRLSHAEARALRDELDDALTRRRRFVHTTGEHRPDGTYVVERATADSGGHRKVFDRFADLRALFDRLPAAFTATDVREAADDLSGNRRHLLVRHLAEHPAFDCELSSRQPLTGRKTRVSDDEADARSLDGAATARSADGETVARPGDDTTTAVEPDVRADPSDDTTTAVEPDVRASQSDDQLGAERGVRSDD